MKRIYLDHAASTPLLPEVARAMRRAERAFGNPNSLHSYGQAARALVDRARERIAAEVGAGFREIIFAGSATEANNLAIRGAIKAYQRKSALRNQHQSVASISINQHPIISVNQRPRLIISAIEHESVLETARDLERSGEAELAVIPVNRRGIVDVKALAAALDERTVLVSVMYVNNEIGTIQPIAEIAKIISNFRNSKLQTPSSKQIRNSNDQNSKNWNLGFGTWNFETAYPLFHVDAAQAFAYLDCGVNELMVDLMTLSAHKMGGPKGIGALYVRNSKFQASNSKQILRQRRISLRLKNSKLETLNGKDVSDFGFRVSDLRLVSPIVTGGNQEFGLRAGTENVPLIAGFAKAVELAAGKREKNRTYVARIRELFLKELKRARAKARPNVPLTDTAPHILNLRFTGVAAEELLVWLDLAGVAVSAGSACTARAALPSHVLLAMGVPRREVEKSIRVSFGVATTAAEVREAARRFAQINDIVSR